MKTLITAAAMTLVIVPSVAFARPVNLVTNGSFETTTASGQGSFHDRVAGWSGGTGLDFVDFPGTADDPNKYLSVYGTFPATSLMAATSSKPTVTAITARRSTRRSAGWSPARITM